MFHFDQAVLPQLTTRKALLVVDFQNDFIGVHNASLPVTEPQGFVNRTIELAGAFRPAGDVVWVQTRFEKLRPVNDDQIIVSDETSPPGPTSQGRRGPPFEPLVAGTSPSPADPEAFLSHEEPLCVKPSIPSCDMPPAVVEGVRNGDLTMTKFDYSAFQDTQLLRMLRGKMVIEVLICGSLANVGVYATAMDAAGHGMAITVVEDCCGYRKESRQIKAIKNLVKLTGCDVASSQEVLETIRPKQPQTQNLVGPPLTSSVSPSQTPATLSDYTRIVRPSLLPDIVRPMTGLSLTAGSSSPSTNQGEADQTSGADPQSTKVADLPGENGPSELRESVRPKTEAETVPVSSKPSGNVEPLLVNAHENEPHPNIGHPQPNKLQAFLPKLSNSVTSPPPSPLAEPLSIKEDMDKRTPDINNESGLLLQRGLCEGDVDVIHDALPNAIAQGAFEKLQHEVRWQRMSHQGGEVPRLVAVQGEVADDGSMPVYRHPADESPPLLPFSPAVLAIKAETEKHIGHSLNHVLIQLYRNGADYISEHSDKTLDIVKGSYIANVSFGAERTMMLRTKRLDKDPSRSEPEPADLKRKVQRVKLSHNSLCRMGLLTNKKWLHAIRQDKRAARDKSAAELAYSSGRISLTFRLIGTFIDRDGAIIWGQGATGKNRDTAHPVINSQGPEAVKMLRAFGIENRASHFDWNAHYHAGFDVLHISSSPRFFASGDTIVDRRIALMLAEYGINYAKGSMAPAAMSKNEEKCGFSVPEVLPIKFVDNDAAKSVICGDVAIMLYLDSCYGRLGQAGTASSSQNQVELARRFTRFQQGLGLLTTWRRLSKEKGTNAHGGAIPEGLKQELAVWDRYAAETTRQVGTSFIAGTVLSLPDFAIWPVLHSIMEEAGPEAFDGLDSLRQFYNTVAELKSAKKALGKTVVPEESD